MLFKVEQNNLSYDLYDFQQNNVFIENHETITEMMKLVSRSACDALIYQFSYFNMFFIANECFIPN